MVGAPAEFGIGAGQGRRPSALVEWAGIMAEIGEARPVVFLDYDGTLTPIVERPEDALLSTTARETVRALALTCPVAVISGRDLSDVRDKVDLDGIVYAGSHGFDIAAPPRLDLGPGPSFDDLLPMLDDAQAELARAVSGVVGAWVERKRFSIAVHHRQVRARSRSTTDATKASVSCLKSGNRVPLISPTAVLYPIQGDRGTRWGRGSIGSLG